MFSMLIHRVVGLDSGHDVPSYGGEPNHIRRYPSEIHRSPRGVDSEEDIQTSGHVGGGDSRHR